jgi:Ser/Thr protein kinase RdoA (MazF antagonist)
LNPGNILFDGKRMWIIDWDAACRNDPFHDLATPCIFALKAPERRARLLRAYLGREETRVESARFQLSYALGLSFYAFVFAGIAPADTAAPKGDAPITPTGAPARFGEVIARDAQHEYTTREYADALALLR